MGKRGPQKKNKNIRKLSRIGKHSFGITLPISVIRQFGWRERQKVVLAVDLKKKRILIKDWKHK